MENLLYDYITRYSSKNCSIILCDDENVLDSKNYEEIVAVTNKLIMQFSTFFNSTTECIGLLMQQNVYLPAIIVSLQKLNQAFTFMGINSLDETINNLRINWILSFEKINSKQIKEVNKIYLDRQKYITVWKKIIYNHPLQMDNIFTVMQTSGTTGKKKIVKIPYSCIESNILCLSKIFGITSKDIIFWGTPLSFDPSLIECLLGIYNGACLLIVPYKIYLNPYSLYKVLFSVKPVTFLQMVPSIFLRWDESHQKNILQSSSLRILSFGGEIFPSSVLEFKRNKSLKLFNLYGITEVSCWATIYQVTELIDNDIPIGESLKDTILEVRSGNGKCIQNGEGEIYIGSSTRICFVDDENTTTLHNPHFRATGDIAKVNVNGIFYKSRNNQVIKRFGHRINLSDIEKTIFKDSGLTNKCIFSKELKKLLCFIQMPDAFSKIFCERTIDKLRVKLMHLLPEESYPDYFEVIKKLPLTSHGKVNTKSLEELYMKSASDNYNLEPNFLFSELWCRYLGLNMETLDSLENCTFSELGGTSIGALQLVTEVKDIMKSKCPDDMLSFILEKNFKECILYLKYFRKRLIKNDSKNQHLAKRIMMNNCFDFLWSYNLKACVDSSPLVFTKSTETYVAVGSFSGMFIVLNYSGQEVYKNIFPDSIQSIPVISECRNFLFIGCLNGSIYCINFLKNTIVWEFITENPIVNSPCICKNNTAIVFGSYNKSVYCLSIKDGCVQWKTEIDGSVSAQPLLDNNIKRIFVFSTIGTCFCLEEDTGHVIFKYSLNEPVFGTPYLLNTCHIVIPTVKNNLICISIENRIISWKFCVGGSIYSSLIVYEEYIIFGCHDEHIYIVKPSSKECNLIGKIELDSKISSSVSVYKVDDKILIIAASNSGIVYFIDLDSISIKDTFKLPNQTFSSPAVNNGKLFIGCRDNNLYCIDLYKIIK